MKSLPDGMAGELASGATTLCWCWRMTRRDDVTLGFTDHDRDLVFDGTTFEAAAGFTASEVKDTVGLNVDNLEVQGAVTSERLDDQDLLAGLYDNARIELFRVNWRDPDQRLLIRTGNLGEVRRADTMFAAEVRGLAHHLQQPKGRLYQYACDADLGDRRCGIDLADPAYRANGTVTGLVTPRRFHVAGLGAFAAEWFARGLLRFTDGANAGARHEVRGHEEIAGETVIELWQEPAHALAAGDGFSITAGCDKVLSTCRDKFANTVNYRGFAQMPGTDLVTSYVRRSR